MAFCDVVEEFCVNRAFGDDWGLFFCALVALIFLFLRLSATGRKPLLARVHALYNTASQM